MRPRALALTIAAGAAAAVGVALVRLRRPRADATGTAAVRETYRCACGEEFRFSGSGRHRVFWRAGAPDGDPVLAARCPACDRPLGPDPAAPAPAAA
jgi:hypothetical protein